MEVWRGTLRAFNAVGYTATVDFLAARGTVLPGVLVSRGIPAEEMVVGRVVFVLVRDTTSTSDAMVVGVY